MADLVLNFSNYIHCRSAYFPQGQLTFKKDDAGNFSGIKTEFMCDGKPNPPRDLNFSEVNSLARGQLAILRSFCHNAHYASEKFIMKKAGKQTSVPFESVINQFSQSGLAIRILDMVIMDVGTVHARNVELQAP